jgi:hypothetical protein
MEQKELKFYDMKAQKSFTTKEYKFVIKSGRKFAVAKSPSGKDCYHIIGKA